MKKHLLRDFVTAISLLGDSEYLLAKIELEVAPIQERLKPSALMTFSKDSRNSYQNWEVHKNEYCAKLRLNYHEMRKTEKCVLVLFYNPVLLKRVMEEPENRVFLSSMGYQAGASLEQILHTLKGKFTCACPHEIGIFLGISKENVTGFIQGGRCLFCGYWKVYHDPGEANKLFSSYDLARHKVIKRLCQRIAPVEVSA